MFSFLGQTLTFSLSLTVMAPTSRSCNCPALTVFIRKQMSFNLTNIPTKTLRVKTSSSKKKSCSSLKNFDTKKGSVIS